MSLKATIFKARIQVANMDRHYYNDHSVIIARHPSETDERMMVRLLAFALHANDTLSFANGLSEADEADLWQKDYTGDIELWIDVGQPNEKLIRKACGRSKQVVIYSYGGQVADSWWSQSSSKLTQTKNLSVLHLQNNSSHEMAKLAERSMKLYYTIQDGEIDISNGNTTVQVGLSVLKEQGGKLCNL
jgi:uncharacterized protein YaeQ